MDVVALSRIQFAVTIIYHFLFVPLSIGTGLVLALAERRFYRSGDPKDRASADFWVKIFTATFAVGVATGISMEFAFGTNWATYSRFVGDIFGAPLAAEGLFAFFLESTFLGVLIFGRDRVSKKFYHASAWLVWAGSMLSALWIIIANSWMQTPAGFKIVTDANGVSKAQMTDFWQATFNPSTLQRLFHTLAACWVVGAFFLMGISAWYVLRHRNSDVTAIALRLAVVVAFLGSGLMFVSGDLQTREVQANQPLKFAAMEGVFHTEKGVALELIGLPPSQSGPAAIPPLAIPNGLSAMTNLDPNSEIKGLDQEPDTSLWPPVTLTWMSFHLMVGLGVLMMLLMLFGAFFWWRRSLDSSVWWLRFAVLAIPLPIIAVELGWMTAEVGRQPWIVQGLMMTSKGVSPGVSATDVGISLLAILLVYALLFFLWIYALTKEIGRGPEAAPVVAALPTAGQSGEGN